MGMPTRSGLRLDSVRARMLAWQVVKYSVTHPADFVPCFVAFEANVRQYAALAVMAMIPVA
jgi:hypothetical protein